LQIAEQHLGLEVKDLGIHPHVGSGLIKIRMAFLQSMNRFPLAAMQVCPWTWESGE
jgi:hypothetical protein